MLVVEDDAVQVGLIRDVLARPGLRIVDAGTLAAAREAITARPPDVVLLDLRLPDGSGLVLLDQIRLLGPDHPAVVVVSGRDGETLAEALALGARDFVAKPYRAFDLEARVLAAVRDQANYRRVLAAQRRLAFLAEAGATLASSPDYASTLERLPTIALPVLGDTCVVYLGSQDSPARPASVADVDPVRDRRLRRLASRSIEPSEAHPVALAIRTKRSWIAGVSPSGRDLGPRRLRRQQSTLVVPLVSGGRAIGALLLVARPPRQYRPDDLALAEEFARRAGAALESARLYRLAQDEIARREQTDRALRRSEALFRHLIEYSLDVISLVDLQGTIIYQSPSIERVLGYAPDELLGSSVFDFFHPDDMAKLRSEFQSVAERPGAIGSARLRFRHKDGSWRVLETVGRRMEEESGRPGIVVSSRDVTEQKRAESERAALQDTLVRLEERERIAMDLHDGAIQSLYGITLSIGAASRQIASRPDEARAALGEVIPRINAVIAEVRSYVLRLRSPEGGGEPLRAALQALVDQYRRGPTTIEVAMSVQEGAIGQALGVGVVDHIVQVTREAVSNAVRHGRARHITVRPRWSRRRFVLIVRDDGDGFDPGGVGPGQGLRNMAERARLLGARLEVVSRPGKGTVIRLDLPLRPSEARRA